MFNRTKPAGWSRISWICTSVFLEREVSHLFVFPTLTEFLFSLHLSVTSYFYFSSEIYNFGDGDIAFHGRAWKLLQRSKSMIKYARRSCQLLLRYIHLHTFIFSPQVTFKWILLCWLCTAAAGFMQVPPRGVCLVLPLLSLADIWSTTWLWVLEAPFPWTIRPWRYIYILKSSVHAVLDLWDITLTFL